MMKQLIWEFIVIAAWLPLAAAAQNAVDLEMGFSESFLYILKDDGTIQTAGEAVFQGSADSISATALLLTSLNEGYYVLEADGTIHTFGNAVNYGSLTSSNRNTRFIDLEHGNPSGLYALSSDGHVATLGGATFYGEGAEGTAADLEVASDGNGYYVLYQDGRIATFGSAINRGFETRSDAAAVDIELHSEGYYVAFSDGKISTFGDIVTLPSNQDARDGLVDMTLTFRGFRTLNEDGEVKSFMNLETVGALQWFAQLDDVRTSQATPTPTVPPTPTPRPSEGFVEELPSGFSETIVGILPEGARIPDFLSTGQASVNEGTIYLITQESESELARTIRVFEAKDFDEEFEGEVFTQLNPARGTAEFRGLSFSRMGLLATVADQGRVHILLIEGNFGESTVSGFLRY